MSIKKCVNGSFVNDVYREYGTDTDTITSLPKTIIGDGQPISSYTIKGNMVQSGTPTPSNPIYPSECGDLVTSGEHAGEYEIPISFDSNTYTFYLSEPIHKIGDYSDDVNSGGTVTRLIRKIVLDGTEDWYFFGSAKPYGKPYDIHQFYTNGLTLGGIQYSSCISNIADYGMNASTRYDNNYGVYLISSGADVAFQMEGSKAQFPDVTAWKQYLATQYATGTPVTVWYQLATPTTETFTAPTLPTTGTAESFDVSTTLKPSEVSLTYHGWHEHSDTKYSNP